MIWHVVLVVVAVATTGANAVNPFGSEVPKVDNYLPARRFASLFFFSN